MGWFGAVLGFLALAGAGLRAPDDAVARGAYVSMNVMTQAAIVPLSLISLTTGLLESLVTPWGFVRHYWVLVKLVFTVAASLLLLLHTRPIGWMAHAAMRAEPLTADLMKLRAELVGDAAAAAVVLVGATVLAIYKPRGLTPYGAQRQPTPVER